jgi:hypothetical protein
MVPIQLFPPRAGRRSAKSVLIVIAIAAAAGLLTWLGYTALYGRIADLCPRLICVE